MLDKFSQAGDCNEIQFDAHLFLITRHGDE